MRIPTSHVLPISELKINRDPIASGGFSDVFRGRFRGQEVCVKRLRVSSTGGPEKVKKEHITPLSIVRRFLMIPTDVVSRGRDMETVKPRQRRPVYRCNFRPPPDCIGMDVGRGSDRSHQVEPAHEQDLPCQYSLYLPPHPKKYGLSFPTVGRYCGGTELPSRVRRRSRRSQGGEFPSLPRLVPFLTERWYRLSNTCSRTSW